MANNKGYDIAIVGGGILGSSIAYWLSEILDARTVVLEKNSDVGLETSARNTGNLHRPFYLDPIARKKFAIAANLGYEMWREIARRERQLPWKQVGTLELATKENQIKTLEKYVEWGNMNGMTEGELELFEGGEEVKKFAPVECYGALLCKTDIAVDFGALTKYIRAYSEENGAKFLRDKEVTGIESEEYGVEVSIKGELEPINAKLLINCAGGNAVDIAHECSLGLEYTDLHFRGDYWVVDPDFGEKFRHNIYTVPEHPKFQFLDPHFIISARGLDGRYEIGPSAAPVAGPYNYESIGLLKFPFKIFEKPVRNKLRLAINLEFLGLAINEITSLSKNGMLRRMKSFIPSIRPGHIIEKGESGIRSSLIAPDGSFVPEAVELSNEYSYHILNYNSPGAAGAIAYAAYAVDDMIQRQLTDGFKRVAQKTGLFDFDKVISHFSGAL